MARDSSNYPRRESGQRRSRANSGDETGDYASRTSRNSTTTTTKKTSRKNQDYMKDLQVAVKLLVFIEVVIILGIVCGFYAVATKRIMTLPRVWTLQVIPGTGHFKDFAVSSSSEHCSELARTMFLEGFPHNLIAASLKFCLDVQQPDRSGELGSSVAVHYSPETGCRYTPGESRMSRNPELIQKFVQEVTADPLMESRGVLTELVPFDMITVIGLLQNSSAEQIEAVKSFLAIEHGNMLIALTTSGVDPLDIGFLIKEYINDCFFITSTQFEMDECFCIMDEQSQYIKQRERFHKLLWTILDAEIEATKDFRVTLFDPNEELSRRNRGDLVAIPEFELRLERYFGALKYMNKHLFRAYLNATLNPYRSINDQTFTSDLAMIEELINSPPWLQTNMTYDGGVDVGYCHPLYPSIAPYVFSILADYRVGAEELSGAYHTADRALTTVYRTLRELYTKVSMIDTPDEWMPLYDILERKEMYRKFGGNYFSMVVNDHGYAFSGTIGSSFGSLSSTAFMNNLAHNFAHSLAHTKGYTNTVYPFIVVKNGSVDVAYSGSCGYPHISFGIPRILFSLVMRFRFGIGFENSLSFPILYPNFEGRLVTDYYPQSPSQAPLWTRMGEVVFDRGFYSDSIAVLYRDDRGVYIPFYKNKRKSARQFNTRAIGV